MPDARIFVGIPTHNRPEFVREAVQSVLRQTVAEDLRVVVSDDASRPEAAEAVERFVTGLADARVEYHRHLEPQREYGQGRFLFSRCRDEDLFLILHDDDRLEPAYLEIARKRLAEHADLGAFVANPYVFTSDGVPSEAMTAAYLRTHGRHAAAEGPLEILEPVLRSGFLPISGTVFRTSALRSSGFVDPDMEGNYPFELDLLLRLGLRGEHAWFEPTQLIGFRMHPTSLRNGLWYDPIILRNLIRLLERFRFEGRSERQRRKFLGFANRRYARVLLAHDDAGAARHHVRRALGVNAASYKSWALAAGAHVAPFALRLLLRRTTPRIGPQAGREVPAQARRRVSEEFLP